ncbi:hypothetical protein [Streptomyces acidiscabies]|uniref:hypothetical protein n=1 Tax=Streptomyces acidiscabies TaxID=42234 RepID=UPI0038F6D236
MVQSEKERELNADLACAHHHLLILQEQEMNPWQKVAQAARLAPEYLHRAVWKAESPELSRWDLAALCYATAEGRRLEAGFMPESGPNLERRVTALAEECLILLRRFRRLRHRDPEAVTARRDQLKMMATTVQEYRRLPTRWWRAALMYSLTPEARTRPPARSGITLVPALGLARPLPLLSQSLIRVAAKAELDPAYRRAPVGETGAREALAWDLVVRLDAVPDELLLHVMRRLEWRIPPVDALYGLDQDFLDTHCHEPPCEETIAGTGYLASTALAPCTVLDSVPVSTR